MVDNGLGKFSIPNDMPRNRLVRRVRQRSGEAEEDEPPVIPTEEELPMDPYNVAMRRFQDNLARSSSSTNMILDYMMQQMHSLNPIIFHLHILMRQIGRSFGESNREESVAVVELVMIMMRNERVLSYS